VSVSAQCHVEPQPVDHVRCSSGKTGARRHCNSGVTVPVEEPSRSRLRLGKCRVLRLLVRRQAMRVPSGRGRRFVLDPPRRVRWRGSWSRVPATRRWPERARVPGSRSRTLLLRHIRTYDYEEGRGGTFTDGPTPGSPFGAKRIAFGDSLFRRDRPRVSLTR